AGPRRHARRNRRPLSPAGPLHRRRRGDRRPRAVRGAGFYASAGRAVGSGGSWSGRAGMTVVPMARPAKSRFEQRIEALDAFCRYLRPRLRGRLKVERTDQGSPPPTWSVIAEDGSPIVAFGLLDTIFFWTL